MSSTVETSAETSVLRRYDAGAIFFHWTMAALVVVVGTIGLLFDDFPRADFPGWLTVHAICGLAILTLAAARAVWRMNHRPPELPGDIGEFTRRTSHAAHMLLYALLLFTPTLGLITFIAHGRYFDFGVVHVGFPFAKTRSVFHPTEVIHQWLAYGLFGLAGVHILAALWHQFVLRDQLLLRMTPASKR